MDESIKRLEEKVAYLERHVTEQDKAMLEFSEDLFRLRKQLLKWQEQASGATEMIGAPKTDERPPHY
ncbi:MAG: SlyX family protein [Opitutaceae bacterium]